jgi:hypothetical protein
MLSIFLNENSEGIESNWFSKLPLVNSLFFLGNLTDLLKRKPERLLDLSPDEKYLFISAIF